MTLKFEVPPSEQPRYAVWSEKYKTLKTYRYLASAKYWVSNNLRYSARGSKILENVEGEWFVLYDISPEAKEYRELPWVKTSHHWNGYKGYRATPMSYDEYAAWRLAVERERQQNQVKTPYLNA